MGDIVGYSWVPARPGEPSGGNHAFLWQNGVMRDLGLAPATSPFSPNSQATTVNDRGTVLAGDWNNNAWIVQDGVWSSLGTHDPTDMNRSGVVIGHYGDQNGSKSYMLRDGVVTDLGGFGGANTVAWAINDKSVITGFAEMPAGNQHAFVYDGTLKDIGTLGGAASYAGDINNHGVVVGRSLDASGATKPFIWDERGGMRALFDAPGFSYAAYINDHGVVLGYINNRAFQYDGGVVTMLDDIPAVRAAGWTQLFPMGINNRGWIVGFGYKSTGNFGGAFVLKPK